MRAGLLSGLVFCGGGVLGGLALCLSDPSQPQPQKPNALGPKKNSENPKPSQVSPKHQTLKP